MATRVEPNGLLYEQFARIGKVLSSPKRIELLHILGQGERSVESLVAACGLGLTTASAHLQVLRQARLVETRREGVKIFYRLADDSPYCVLAAQAVETLRKRGRHARRLEDGFPEWRLAGLAVESGA